MGFSGTKLLFSITEQKNFRFRSAEPKIIPHFPRHVKRFFKKFFENFYIFPKIIFKKFSKKGIEICLKVWYYNNAGRGRDTTNRHLKKIKKRC